MNTVLIFYDNILIQAIEGLNQQEPILYWL